MMRSLLLERPVIVLRDNAMEFIKKTGVGCVIKDSSHIHQGSNGNPEKMKKYILRRVKRIKKYSRLNFTGILLQKIFN